MENNKVKTAKECIAICKKLDEIPNTKLIWVGFKIKGYSESGYPIYTDNVDDMKWELHNASERHDYTGLYWRVVPAFE